MKRVFWFVPTVVGLITVVFVISQDAELRVFCSDTDTAYRCEHLDAWVSLVDVA